MIARCPLCEAPMPGAHAPTCPTSSHGAPMVVGSQGACPSCGGTGYHKPECPSAMLSRPDPDTSAVQTTPHEVITRVLRVHRDIGNAATPSAVAAEIISELIRYGHKVT